MPRKRKSQRLDPVSRLAKDSEHKAAAALGECARQCRDQEQKLAELEDFRREYRRRFEDLGSRGAQVKQINDYRRFIEQLDQAVAQQRKLTEEIRRRLELHNRHWTERRSKRRALDKVIDRFRTEEGRAAHSREQREADERAQHTGSAIDEDG